MFDIDRWQQIYSVLKKNKVRTLLTAFGVFWGIFMLVVMLGAGNGLINGITQGIGEFATNSFFMWGQQTTESYKGFPKGRRINFKNKDIESLKQNVQGIEYIAPKLQMGSYNSNGNDNVVRGLKSGSYNINGDYPDFNKIDPSIMVKGRFINQNDIKEERKVVVIGERVHGELFEANEQPIGKYIRIQGVYFQVVGVFKPLNPNISFGGDKERSVTIPFTTFQQAYNYGDNIGFMAITAKEGYEAKVVEENTIKLMNKTHTISPEDEQAIGHINIEKEYKKMVGLFTGIGILIWIVGTGTLLAGIIGVSNIMLVVVKERTVEIGIQRALGATPWNIINQILSEAAALTVLAGYFGLAAGVGVMGLLGYALENSGANTEMFSDPQINFNIAMAALGVLVFFGVLAGLLPAKRAVKIKPIEAIRNS
ncbi:MAG: ABC transporter permease [Bacteroidales bacterium]